MQKTFSDTDTRAKARQLRQSDGVSSAQFIDTFFPVIDGVVRTVDNYARKLDPLAGCIVLAPETEKGYTDDFPYRVLRAKSFSFVHGYSVPAPTVSAGMINALRAEKISIYHAHSPFMMGHFARRESKKLGIPLVTTFHSKYYDDFLRTTGSSVIASQLTDYIVRFYQSADAVWAVSPGTAETLRSYGYKGDITVMDNGTDLVYPDNAQALRESAFARYSLPKDKKILLFVGQQIWEKNLRLILDTLALLNRDGNGYCLVSVGTGYDSEKIQKYSSELGQESSTVFIGRVEDRESLSALYLASDLFFFPSQYDNAPLVVREAAAMGKPSLLLAGSNSADRIEPGKNGFVCGDSAESACAEIKRIFSSPELLSECGENAKRSVAVSWDEIIPRVMDEYKNIIGRTKR